MHIQNKYFLDAIKNVIMCYTIILYYYYTTVHCHHTKSTHHPQSFRLCVKNQKSKIINKRSTDKDYPYWQYTSTVCVAVRTRVLCENFFSYMIVQQPNLQPNNPLALDIMLLAGSPRASRFSLNNWSASLSLSSTAELTCGYAFMCDKGANKNRKQNARLIM